MSEENTETPEPAPPPKKRGKLVIILVLVGVLLAGGGAAAFWYLRPVPTEEAEAIAEPPAPQSTGIVGFDPFVVNLADSGGRHFLKISVQLVVVDHEVAESIQEDGVQVMRLRSAILELLSEQASTELITAAGKLALKAAITDRASAILQEATVSDVLFSDFIVQF